MIPEEEIKSCKSCKHSTISGPYWFEDQGEKKLVRGYLYCGKTKERRRIVNNCPMWEKTKEEK